MTIGDETREEVEEAVTHLNYRAKRCFPVVGTEEHPSDWDVAHARVNDMLDARDRTAVTA